MIFKRRAALGAVAALSLVLAACGGDDGDSPDAGADADTEEDAGDDDGDQMDEEEPIEITVGTGDTTITWWHIATGEPLLSLFEEFAREYAEANDVTIEITVIANDPFKSAIALAAQAGDMPDMFQTWGGGVLKQQVDAGLVSDITDETADWIEDISGAARASYMFDDQLYGLGWNTGMVGFWYNTELFEQAGIDSVPETWDQFLDVVQQLKAAGITPIALAAGDEWPAHFYWSYLAMRVAGLDGVQAAAEARSFESEEFVRAGELLQELIDLEPFQDGFLGAGYDADGSQGYMARGEAAMELMGQWAPGALDGTAAADEDEDAEPETLPSDTLGFFAFPAVEGGAGAHTDILGGGDGIAVSSTAPDEAVDFLAYLFEIDQLERFVQVGTATPVSNPPEASGEVWAPFEPLLATLGEATGAHLYFDQDFPPTVGDQIKSSVAQLFAGQASPEEVAEAITIVWQREPN